MKKLLKWAIITFGVAALARWWRGRGSDEVAAEPSFEAPAAGDPADELRRKLAETRPSDEAAETPESAEASVDDRRAEVHAEGRAALDDMQSPSDDQ
ncbi:MAG: hypothetical protein R6W48_01430 [Gaiellaceae bacterium]